MKRIGLAIAVLAAGCGGGDDEDGSDLPEGCDALVEPGSGDDVEAIQTALIEAEPGSTVCLAEGTFTLNAELSLAQEDVTVRGAGMDATLLDFGTQDVGANSLHVTADGCTLEGFEVRDPVGDGVRASSVVGFTARALRVKWSTPASVENGGYALYPVQSERVLIEDCEVSGASDTGIYVGQSKQILVRRNEAFGNVSGIEIENSTDAEVVDNHTHDNTAGILVFNLPELPVRDGKRAKVHRNRVENNNLANFAKEGTILALVPAGTGILVMAADDNEIADNDITGNKSLGVAITSYLVIFPPYEDPSFDRFATGNWVHDNRFSGNGAEPDGIVGSLDGLPDLVPAVMWDGCVDEAADRGPEFRNCFDDNGGASYADFGACRNFEDVSTDRMPVDCAHDPLPAQTL